MTKHQIGTLAALERRRAKTRGIKQGMMQQLLAGRVQLIKPETLQNGKETAWIHSTAPRRR